LFLRSPAPGAGSPPHDATAATPRLRSGSPAQSPPSHTSSATAITTAHRPATPRPPHAAAARSPPETGRPRAYTARRTSDGPSPSDTSRPIMARNQVSTKSGQVQPPSTVFYRPLPPYPIAH